MERAVLKCNPEFKMQPEVGFDGAEQFPAAE